MSPPHETMAGSRMQFDETAQSPLDVIPAARRGQRIHILFLGDDPGEGKRLREALERVRPGAVEITRVGSPASLPPIPSSNAVGLILVDLGPDARGDATRIAEIRRRAPSVPLIALADGDDAHREAVLARAGVRDCLLKEEASGRRLDRAIRHAIERDALRTALRTRNHDLRVERRRLKTLIGGLCHGILIVDATGTIRFANEAACVLFGRKRGGIIGRRFPAASAGPEAPSEIDIPVSPHLTKIAEVHAVETEWEGQPAKLVSLHDITRRKIMEEALRESERRSRSIIETATDAFVAMDSCGLITDWNRKAEKLFAIARPDAIGRSFAETILPPEYQDTYISEIGRFMATGKQPCLREQMELLGRRLDGSTFPIEIKIWPVKTGETYRFNAFIEDISERRKLQRLKDEFIQTASHELRTPLTTMREGISQVAEGLLGGTTPEQDEFLDIIVKDIDRLTRIINDLLDMSRIDAEMVSLRIQPVDFGEIVDAVGRTFQPRAQEKGLELRIRCGRPGIVANADRDKMIQVLTNLVGNAVKFTERGHIEIGVVSTGDGVACAVSDTGRGIPESERAHIFDKFRQFGRIDNPREKGTGLGLYIVKKIIELHGGTIDVDDRPGGGTTFTLTLPRRQI